MSDQIGTGLLSKVLQRRCAELHINQKEAAERCHITPEYFNDLWQGKKWNISFEYAMRIAKGLELSGGVAALADAIDIHYEIPVKGIIARQNIVETPRRIQRVPRPPWITDSNCYAVLVQTDDLLPRYRNGELLLLDTTISPQNGDDVVGQLDADCPALFEFYQQDGRVTLLPLPRGNPQIVGLEAVVFLHKVSGTRKP